MPMNSSQFMDKQIMALSGSQGGEIFDLMNPQDDEHGSSSNGGVTKEEILPNYDFQPIRTVGFSSSINAGLDGARQPRGSIDSKIGSSSLRLSGLSEPQESATNCQGKEKDSFNVATSSEIDRIVKKHVDNLLHALEGVSSRLSQVESRTRYLESSFDELKVSIGNTNSSTDGKLRQLENVLKEVQTGITFLRDKQEIAEAQLQLEKLQASKRDHHHPPVENSNTQQPPNPSLQQPALHQPSQQLPQAPIVAPQQLLPPLQFPAQQPQPQAPPLPSLPPTEPYFHPPAQQADPMHQQYQMPAQQADPMHQQYQMPAQQADPMHQQYQMPAQPPPPPQMPHYSQPMQPPQHVKPLPQFQPPSPHHPEETYTPPPPQSYNQNVRPPSSQPPSGPPQQQYYGPNQGIYGPPPPPGPSFNEPYPYSGPPSHYSSQMKQTSGSNYQRLPTAQILPQALPTAGSSSGGGSGSGSGNRMPIDDVVDKVATMGFSREQVRATVRKLTENGQSVDLNVVLDKLMNDGGIIQPQKGWFGR